MLHTFSSQQTETYIHMPWGPLLVNSVLLCAPAISLFSRSVSKRLSLWKVYIHSTTQFGEARSMVKYCDDLYIRSFTFTGASLSTVL